MPASRVLAVLTIILVVTSAALALPRNQSAGTSSSEARLAPSTLSSRIDEALSWLAHNQSADGSYGLYREHWTADAAYALWLNSSTSPYSTSAYLWLTKQINSTSAWFWGQFGEADVPGAILYSLAASHHLANLNISLVKESLLQFQKPASGFSGYYDLAQKATVTSSVDTDMALLGLISAGEIDPTNRTFAINYDLSLQNQDGSFNLTRSIGSDPFYSLGPDPASITALTLLVLKSGGFTRSDPHVSSALEFLGNEASSDFSGHVYAASLSALAFKAYDEPANAVTAVAYILSQQGADHGFSDSSRTSIESNALDTGWAAIALETSFSEEAPPPPINNPPIADFVYSPVAVVVRGSVRFDASSSRDSDNDQLSFAWTFGDGSSATGPTASHVYSQSGNFTATLTVTDSGINPVALSNTRSLTVNVQPASVENASKLPFTSFGAAILLGIVGLMIIVGIAIYLNRRKTGSIR